MLMANQSTYREFEYIDLGFIDYKEAWDLQKTVFDLRVKKEIKDIFFLLEHPHTYTLGKTADSSNLVSNKEFLDKYQISVYNIDRGGDITYHGPGQIVGYPILDLDHFFTDIHKYLRLLEQVIIDTLDDFEIMATRSNGETGVWLDVNTPFARKICAMGIRASRWVTMHGFSLNVNTNLSNFDHIVPCGIRGKQVTSMAQELTNEVSISEVKKRIKHHFQEKFDTTLVR